jgi:hypothetical protein
MYDDRLTLEGTQQRGGRTARHEPHDVLAWSREQPGRAGEVALPAETLAQAGREVPVPPRCVADPDAKRRKPRAPRSARRLM